MYDKRFFQYKSTEGRWPMTELSHLYFVPLSLLTGLFFPLSPSLLVLRPRSSVLFPLSPNDQQNSNYYQEAINYLVKFTLGDKLIDFSSDQNSTDDYRNTVQI
jgi:hypothetical protein